MERLASPEHLLPEEQLIPYPVLQLILMDQLKPYLHLPIIILQFQAPAPKMLVVQLM